MRASYDDFRSCYEKALAKDPTVQGRVVVRFVIGRAGKVSLVEDGSTLADADAVVCVVAEYEKLRFPQPEDGIVTVIYPIQLPESDEQASQARPADAGEVALSDLARWNRALRAGAPRRPRARSRSLKRVRLNGTST